MKGMMAISGTQRNATSALAEFDDKRAVGYWALALTYPGSRDVALAHKKLVALLPLLSASDSRLLDDEQRAALYTVLGQRQVTIDLKLAILGALEQVGDEKATPCVQKLA
ncbi:MAG TPA: hypothetical protein VKT77_21815 [Chthonomonadaceae bacterium]|nr:hypothetical protein [Chthonomonadaceae bacterium]